MAGEFRRRGKIVIAGGPFASLSPSALRAHVDILVIGEIESVASQLFSDLDNERWSPEYVGGRWDLSRSPMPRWSLYRNDRALVGCVQTSRGCPFDCEFCDVIAYLGRHQRHKPVEQVLAELDVLYGLGYRNAFIADDNFTAYRRRARELLHALKDWNASRTDGPMMFGTQLSIDAARDLKLVSLCASAGIDWVFIGIETPNEASLRECKKPQNLLLDLQTGINSFLAHGIAVTGGMIVGFDHDGPDIFKQQHDFAMASAVPIFSVGALVAPAATPLYSRMQREHRLIEGGPEVAALPWDTNIIPVQMTRKELLAGMHWLCNSLYEPRSFWLRLERMIDMLAPHPLGYSGGRRPRHVEMDGLMLTKKLASLGVQENELIRNTLATIKRRPHAARAAMTALLRYAQLRFMYERGDFWDRDPSNAVVPTRPSPRERGHPAFVPRLVLPAFVPGLVPPKAERAAPCRIALRHGPDIPEPCLLVQALGIQDLQHARIALLVTGAREVDMFCAACWAWACASSCSAS